MGLCPKVTVQQLDWSGKPTGFSLAPAPAAACKTKVPKSSAASTAAAAAAVVPVWAGNLPLSFLAPAWHSSAVVKTYDAWLQAWGLGEPSTTLTELLLLLLAVCQAGSWSAAAVLYGSDVSSVLEQLCSFADPGVQAVVQKLYRWGLQGVNLLVYVHFCAVASPDAAAAAYDCMCTRVHQLASTVESNSKMQFI